MKIKSLKAQQVYSDCGTIGIEVLIESEHAESKLMCTPAVVKGKYEKPVNYDASDAFSGMALSNTVEKINNEIASNLLMQDYSQSEFDRIIKNYSEIGTIGTAALSNCFLVNDAKESGVSIYKKLGKRTDIKTPLPTMVAAMGSTRYSDVVEAGGKPEYMFAAQNTDEFFDAEYALWSVYSEYTKILTKAFGFKVEMDSENMVPKGYVESDEEILKYMKQAIDKLELTEKIGIIMNVGAGHYYKNGSYNGLFSTGEKSRQDIIDTIKSYVDGYPIIAIIDPLEPDDNLEGIDSINAKIVANEAIAGRCLNDIKDIIMKYDGIVTSAAYAGTVSDALKIAEMAGNKLIATDPVHGEDTYSAQYAVGLGCDMLLKSGISFICNEVQKITEEIREGK